MSSLEVQRDGKFQKILIKLKTLPWFGSRKILVPANTVNANKHKQATPVKILRANCHSSEQNSVEVSSVFFDDKELLRSNEEGKTRSKLRFSSSLLGRLLSTASLVSTNSEDELVLTEPSCAGNV